MRGTVPAFIFPIVAVLGFAQLVFGADPNTNFTGEWKVNVQKSAFGPLFAPKAAKVKIEHKDNTLAITDKETNEQGESSTVESNFTTDGKQTSGTIIAFPMEVKGTAKWVGNTLTFAGDGKFNGTNVHIEEKWELARDNATFTITRTLSAVMGTALQAVRLEK